MRRSGGVFILCLAAACCVSTSYSQDSQSLGDVARQTRQQKQKQPTKDTVGKDAKSKTAKVITNDEIPEHPEVVSHPGSTPTAAENGPASSTRDAKISPEQWKSQIQAQKNAINSLQHDMDSLNDSIRFTRSNCTNGCGQWNEQQREKQQDVERMRAQLEDQKKRLEDMQEAARQQGYGSSVYDP
jgi:chromosome segregation ATPase